MWSDILGVKGSQADTDGWALGPAEPREAGTDCWEALAVSPAPQASTSLWALYGACWGKDLKAEQV